MEKKKVFISLPMNGKTDEEIKDTIEYSRRYLTDRFKNKYELEFLDTFINEETTSKNPGLWYLGKSLEILADADIAFFCGGWDSARGCKLENQAAYEYGIEIIEVYE